MKRKTVCLALLLALFLSFVSCSDMANDGRGGIAPDGMYLNASLAESGYMFGESYDAIIENPFYYTSAVKESYFSMDSNTASYANLRRYLQKGHALNADIIKTDELVNYFDYSYPHPVNGDTFLASAELSDAPWNTAHKFLTVAVTAKEVDLLANQGRNYVFLIDVSGSMDSENKLPLVKKSLGLLIDRLQDSDTVSVVTYASGVKTRADGIKGSEKEKLKSIISGLRANGATAGADGLDRAYALAEKHKIPGGNNRIIIFSDGDFNVGTSSKEGIEALVSKKRESGIFLTCLGYGMGNFRDTTMETISKNGNGGYYYIDSMLEAEKVLVTDLEKTMVTVAKDTKAQMVFNPETVNAYRLIGYENKLLTAEDFADETKDAGEIGSGSTSVVCYELELKEGADESSKLFDLSVRYKDPVNDHSASYAYSGSLASLDRPVTDDHRFVTALVGFALLLRNSPYRGQINYTQVETLLQNAGDFSGDKLKTEFASLVRTAKSNGTVADPAYQQSCTIIIGCGDHFMCYVHPCGEVLKASALGNAVGDPDAYRFSFYYDMAFTEPYRDIEVSSPLNLFVKAEKITKK